MPAIDIERIRQKRKKLEADLKAIKAQENLEMERYSVVVGLAVLSHAEKHPDFNETLKAILNTEVKKKGDRKLLGLQGTAREARKVTELQDQSAGVGQA